jgi:hypothetical protein
MLDQVTLFLYPTVSYITNIFREMFLILLGLKMQWRAEHRGPFELRRSAWATLETSLSQKQQQHNNKVYRGCRRPMSLYIKVNVTTFFLC